MKILEKRKNKQRLDHVKVVRCDNSAVHIENGNLDRQISEELATLSLKQHRAQADRNLEIYAARMRIRDHQERMKIMRAMRAASAPSFRSLDVAIGLPTVTSLLDTAEETTVSLELRSRSSKVRSRTGKLTSRSVTLNLNTVAEESSSLPAGNVDTGADAEDKQPGEEQKDSDGDEEEDQTNPDVAIVHRLLPQLHQNAGNRALTTARSRRQMDESSRPSGQGQSQKQGQRPYTSPGPGGAGAEHVRRRRLLTLGQMMHMDDDAMTVQQLRQTHRIDVRVEQEREKRRLAVLERRKALHAQRTVLLLERLRSFCLALDNMKQSTSLRDTSAIFQF